MLADSIFEIANCDLKPKAADATATKRVIFDVRCLGSLAAANMGYGLRRNKVEGGSGGKRGHSNMVHWEYAEEIKQREARQALKSPEGVGS